MVSDELQEKLEAQIASQLDGLSKLNHGSDEHKNATADVERLYRLALENSKQEQELEHWHDEITLKDEENEREDQIRKEENKRDWIKFAAQLGTTAATSIASILFYEKWMRAGYQFETEGMITSKTFMEFKRNLKLPFKK